MKRFLLLAFFVCALVTTSQGIPAYRGAINATQPDGSVVTYYLSGDEWSHKMVTTDGYLLQQDADGFFRYARLDAQNKLSVEGSPVVHNPAERTLEEKQFVRTLQKATELSYINKNARPAPARSSGSASKYQIGNYPTQGKGKCIVLLVQFTDVKFTFDKDFHNRMLNEAGFAEEGATGSAHDYYYAQSNGQFEPQFDVVGPITLSHAASYYGQNNSFQTDVNVGSLLVEACKAAHNDYGVDFSEYDGDNDGKVDMVYFIYAGYGEHAGGGASTIWPHKYQLSGFGLSLLLDGKAIDVYACSSELFGNSGAQSSGIGSICHEFGHVLGFADHYSTDDSSQYRLGSYDIMDYGSYNNNSWTPPYYNAFERMTLGWMTPDELTDRAEGITLDPISESNKAYMISTSNPDEFYLLENRQQKGWDAYLPGSGLMITHVDFDASSWNSNTMNDDDSHPRFYLVTADNEAGYDLILNKTSEKYDLYPCTSRFKQNNKFTDTSSPAAKPYTGETLDKWVTEITNEDGVVTFNFMENHLDTPKELAANVLADDSFTASWEAIDRADSYDVTLYQLDYRSALPIALNEDFSAMTEGTVDAPSTSNIDEQLDGYTTDSGWTGSKVYQAGGWCQIGSSAAAGSLTTPTLNLKRNDGGFVVAVTAKSVTGKSPVLSVTANGQTGKTRITSTARTYLFHFTSGISATNVTFATNNERALIDAIVIARGDADSLFADAKAVTVSGDQEVTEGEVEDTDFIHVGEQNVTGVTTNSYTFTGLNPHTYYSFTVKAHSDNAESKTSEELTVYLDKAASIALPATADLEGKPVYYTLDGRQVASPSQRGIYIVRKGSQTRKITIR